MEGLEKLLAEKDENECFSAVSDYLSRLCSFGGNLEKLSGPQKCIYFNDWWELEVNNGGIDQFFFNSSGGYAHQTVESLKTVGAYANADILERAISKFPNGIVPQDVETRHELLIAFEEDDIEFLNRLDDEFYEYPEDLLALNIDYIKKNIKDF
ncbi:MAG: DMP19 family protein [Clostridiales bacterium]|nr:DMP19 family protein [Clostridiales bacterium]